MFLGAAHANPDATASISIVLPAKPCYAAGVQASGCTLERAGSARAGSAGASGARAGFQPYQAVLCLDSNGAPVDHFCPQSCGVQDAAAERTGARRLSAGNAVQARSDDDALDHLVQVCRLLRRMPGERSSAYAVPQQVLRELPASLVRAAERSVRQRCARLCFQEFNEYQRAQALCVLVPPAGSPPTANASPDGAPDAGAPAAPADLSAAADLFAAADADCEPSAFVLDAGGAAGGSPAAADVLAAALAEAEEPPGGTTVAVRAAAGGGAAAGAPPDAGGAQP